MSTTSTLSNSIRGRYINDYQQAAMNRRVYEHYCYPISNSKEILQNSSSVTVPFLSEMSRNANAISETVDITPQTLKDATASISPDSRADAIQDSEKLLLQVYTDYGKQRFEVLGRNLMGTIEDMATLAALNGSLDISSVARASLDSATTTDYAIDSKFFEASNMLAEMECPAIVDKEGNPQGIGYIATMHPDAFFDLISTGLIDDIIKNQDKNIWINGALKSFNGFQIRSDPFAKVFGSAGANHDSADSAYTLGAKAEALAKTLTIGTATNVASGRYLTIGTEETGSTFYPMNERVRHVSGTTTSVIVGRGVNGGLKYEHALGAGVRNADSVYPILFGGPKSVAKIFASDVGEFGKVVGPKMTGLADQFVSLAWKYYGGYAIINENWLVRQEVASSLDNV